MVCDHFNNGFSSLGNEEKATSYSCHLYANVGVIFSRTAFTVMQLLMEVSITITHSRDSS